MRPITIERADSVLPGDRVLVGHRHPFLANVDSTRRRYTGLVDRDDDNIKITVKNQDLLMVDDFDVPACSLLLVQRGTSGLDR